MGRDLPAWMAARIRSSSDGPGISAETSASTEETLLLQLLAVDAVAGPGDRVEAQIADRLAARGAASERAGVDATQRLLDLEQRLALGVGQREREVAIAVEVGAVDLVVAVAERVETDAEIVLVEVDDLAPLLVESLRQRGDEIGTGPGAAVAVLRRGPARRRRLGRSGLLL